MAKRRTRADAPKPERSVKAGRPPKATASTPRGQKTAHTAVRKDTMIMQTDRGPRARWPASRPEFKKS
jgi:hypothetical protein